MRIADASQGFGMSRTYAVAWRIDRGSICVGELELGAAVLLGGAEASGRRAALCLRRDEIASVRQAVSGERLRRRQTLVVVRHDGVEIAVASLDRPGTALELHEALRQADDPAAVASRRLRQ